ncbi:xylan -beta-xylosidase [Colletotrichum incanum]|uniref:Xylan-beta-xylosidase n=1 Tax=Colletotrichum incanum TaxID=1573173 RepID=A0A167AY57_COLIC|nr:xylan -beta-xylosidase [Colletotrichum incanum]OHW99128.1 xylan-beta-xylosidase [Colletotrichum incanum]
MKTSILRALLALSALFITAQAIWNPVISGFNPNPAILRVGEDYYIATPSFEYWPGMLIYHSKDLSNWTLISHALTRPEQLQLYGVPTGAGAWAPSLAYFKGKFWLSGMTRWTYDPQPASGRGCGGTDELHRASIARGKSPSGPFEPCPHNPLMYNGQWGATNLTVQSTGHATFVEAADGAWYASFIAPRNVNGSSPLGRETFLAEVTWQDDWPIINHGKPILLSEEVGPKMGSKPTPAPWTDDFSGKELDPSWSLLRTPYATTYDIYNGRLVFRPSVFGLGDREHPAAVLRKQTSLNMTFSADFWRRPLNASGAIPGGRKLHIRAEPLVYRLGYSFGGDEPTYVAEVESRWQAFAPAGHFVFKGASFALFATGEREP